MRCVVVRAKGFRKEGVVYVYVKVAHASNIVYYEN